MIHNAGMIAAAQARRLRANQERQRKEAQKRRQELLDKQRKDAEASRNKNKNQGPTSASYLYNPNTNELIDLDKTKFSESLYKIVTPKDLTTYYNKELEAKKDIKKIFFNDTYEDTVKKLHFNKLASGVYTYRGKSKCAGIIVTINVSKESLLGIISKNNSKKVEPKEENLPFLSFNEPYDTISRYIKDEVGAKYYYEAEKIKVEIKSLGKTFIAEKVAPTQTSDKNNGLRQPVGQYWKSTLEIHNSKDLLPRLDKNLYLRVVYSIDCGVQELECYIIDSNENRLQKLLSMDKITKWQFESYNKAVEKIGNNFREHEICIEANISKDVYQTIYNYYGELKKRFEARALVETVSKRDFLGFEAVRQSGVTNMFARDVVCQLAGISKEVYNIIVKEDNYSKLKGMYIDKTIPIVEPNEEELMFERQTKEIKEHNDRVMKGPGAMNDKDWEQEKQSRILGGWE